MRLNHITYHLTLEGIKDNKLNKLMSELGYIEIKPDDPAYTHEFVVRWFFNRSGEPLIHFVAAITTPLESDNLDLGHMCVEAEARHMNQLRESSFKVRDSGSGRIWLQHDALRVEARPVIS